MGPSVSSHVLDRRGAMVFCLLLADLISTFDSSGSNTSCLYWPLLTRKPFFVFMGSPDPVRKGTIILIQILRSMRQQLQHVYSSFIQHPWSTSFLRLGLQRLLPQRPLLWEHISYSNPPSGLEEFGEFLAPHLMATIFKVFYYTILNGLEAILFC